MAGEGILYIFGALMGVIAIQSLLLIFIIWKTPALTFLKAALLKKSLIYIIGKDRLGEFKTFTKSSGAAKVGKEGLYHLTENSHTLEAGSKIPIYFAFRDLAATLLPEYPAIIQELREQGLVINNLEDVDNYITRIKNNMMHEIPIQVHAYKTYKMHDLENMFPNNLDPTFVDATVQCEVSQSLKMTKNAPMILGGIAVLIVVAAVAIYILNMSFGGQIPIAECQDMVRAVQDVSQNMGSEEVIKNMSTDKPIAD